MKTNKELKAAYKQLKPVMGVFQVQNKSSKKVLIEGSTNITSKWNRHLAELKLGNHRNKALQNDWNRLGEENLIFSIIEILDDQETQDVKKEIAVLLEMVIQEVNLEAEMKY